MPISWVSIDALTRNKYIPVLADNVYKSNPLFLYAYQTSRIELDGGPRIRHPLLISQEPVTWYSGFDTIDITPVDPVRYAELNWKLVAAAVTIDGESEIANAGESQVLSLVESRLHNAEMSIRDQIGVGIFSDGTNPKMIDGLRVAINTGNTYAGINRATNTWWNANVFNASSADPTFSLFQMQGFGPATQGNTMPDLVVTTQPIFNKLWIQALPQQRFGEGDEIMVGWPIIRVNRARIVADSHCPSGYAFFLNMEFVKIIVHQDRNFVTTPWLPSMNQDARTMRIHWAGNLLVNNPRFQSVITNLNES